ncbi:hypothetical protein OPT61_g3516 [Boeremia exigua]|uniref:Uncharacterized protein n=1 Tax=Boeremia exigua TaxID=749465 RepID=A0ACC2IHI2_9PLEO|nr:hypothetical protein OPT61_g3516 [Boeremia exigua]
MACCILTAVLMNQLIRVCDALDIRFLQIKYNDDEGDACAPAKEDDEVLSHTSRMTVGGMTCAACSTSVVEQLEALHGVHRASVSLTMGRATVSYDASAIKPEEMLDTVRKAGYDATFEEQSTFETIERLNQSSELLEIKQAISSALLFSSVIIILEYLPKSANIGAPPLSLQHVSAYLALLLAAKVQILDAWSIHQRAWTRHGRRKMSMETLLSLSLLLGIGLALLLVFLRQHRKSLAYASSGSFMTIVILAGRYIEAVLKKESNRNIAALYELQTESEMYQLAHDDRSLPASLLKRGDDIFIKPQATIPCDCFIVEGGSAINESTITGEALPVVKNVGDLLLAGTKNLSSRILVTVVQDQSQSSLAKIIEGVTAATEQKLEGTEPLDAIMNYFVSVVLILAFAAFSAKIYRWQSISSVEVFVAACERAATVLAAACPCGIGLAIPSATMAGIDIACSQGILLGSGIKTMQAISSITHVVMDKTGTLTQGRLAVISHHIDENLRINRQLCYRLLAAAEFEEARVHPVASAVFKWALSNVQHDRPQRRILEHKNYKRVLGMGVSCDVKAHSEEWIAVHVGHTEFLSSNGISIPPTQDLKDPAASTVHFAFSNRYAGSLVIRDIIRPDASTVVTKLLHSGRQVTMLTGDDAAEATRISNVLGIHVLASRALPHDKLAHVKQLQACGHRVAMVGDGVNDVPAQAAANVGVSISRTQGCLVGLGSVVIISGDLHALVALFAISERVVRQAKMNVWWALAYNILALSLALGLWEPWGWDISRSMAGTLMAGSSASVLCMMTAASQTEVSLPLPKLRDLRSPRHPAITKAQIPHIVIGALQSESRRAATITVFPTSSSTASPSLFLAKVKPTGSVVLQFSICHLPRRQSPTNDDIECDEPHTDYRLVASSLSVMESLDLDDLYYMVGQGWQSLKSTVYKAAWNASFPTPNSNWSFTGSSAGFSKMRAQSLLLFSLPTLFGSAQETCDLACQAAFTEVQAYEASNWVSKNVTLDSFYSTPTNITGAQPGDLLRWEDLSQDVVNTKFSPPSGMSISRFLYMTEDIDRKPIPASAFVLLPYSRPDSKKPFNTAVWTHGTAGRIRNCAPSNHKDLYYEWQGPYALATAGYAVIAPDYAGQGSDIPQGFMYEAGYLHAADVAYGLIAARKAIGDLLSAEWVVIGHSEGGMTAWRTNERLAMPGQEDLLKAGKFLGAVANSPALRPLDLVPESIRRAAGGPIGDAVSVFFLQSLALLFPDQIRVEDYVTDTVLDRIPLLDQGCLLVGRTLFSNLTKDELFKDMSWLEHPAVVDWQNRYNGAGPHALAAPMLVVQGITDPLTYANNTEWDFKQSCDAFPESRATLILYPDTDHNMASQVAQLDSLTWIKDRFDRVEVPEGCMIKTAEPATNHFRNTGSFYSGTGGD